MTAVDPELPTFASLRPRWNSILLGNGASIAVSRSFRYDSIFAKANLTYEGAAFLELPEPALDERLAFGIAVAAAPLRDASGGEVAAEVPRRELRSVVRAERECPWAHGAGEGRVLDDVDGFVVAAAQLDAPPGDLTGAAIDDRMQIDPAVLGGPDLGHVDVPQLVRSPHTEVTGPATTIVPSGWLQEPVRAHHALHAFAVHPLTEFSACEGGDHARAVGRVLLRDLDDRCVVGADATWPGGDRPACSSVDRLS